MTDTIEKIGRSIVQHGPYNRRVYLMKLHYRDTLRILPAIDRLATVMKKKQARYLCIKNRRQINAIAALKKYGTIVFAGITFR